MPGHETDAILQMALVAFFAIWIGLVAFGWVIEKLIGPRQ